MAAPPRGAGDRRDVDAAVFVDLEAVGLAGDDREHARAGLVVGHDVVRAAAVGDVQHPLPGQPDLSQPQITLPPPVQELLDSLTPEQRQQLPEQLPTNPEQLQQELEQLGVPTTDQNTGQLLDYLLAP